MFSTRKRLVKYNMDIDSELEELNELLNNPLCTIIRRYNYITTDITYDSKTGRPLSSTQTPHCEVEYLEKVLDG